SKRASRAAGIITFGPSGLKDALTVSRISEFRSSPTLATTRAVRLDGLSKLDQTFHVVVNAGGVGRLTALFGGHYCAVDVGREHLARCVSVVMAPCLRVRAGKCDSR